MGQNCYRCANKFENMKISEFAMLLTILLDRLVLLLIGWLLLICPGMLRLLFTDKVLLLIVVSALLLLPDRLR